MAKKKEYKVIGSLNTGIFDAYVTFSCRFTYDEIVENLKQQNCHEWAESISEDKEFIDNGYHFALKRTVTKKTDTRTYFFIILKDFRFTDQDYCELAHEVLHICQFLLPDVLDRNREFECEAYLHTHLMKQCLKLLRGK